MDAMVGEFGYTSNASNSIQVLLSASVVGPMCFRNTPHRIVSVHVARVRDADIECL
jgi:hypothetical protein